MQHDYAEGDSRNPGDKADDCEDREEKENNSARPVSSGQHVDGGRKSSDDMDDTSDPDELLGKCAGQPDVCITEYHGHGETESEENDSVGVEAEIVVAVIDTAAIESLGRSYSQLSALFHYMCQPAIQNSRLACTDVSTHHSPEERCQRRRHIRQRPRGKGDQPTSRCTWAYRS